MIIRESLVDGHQWVFTQVEHARASGDAFTLIQPQFYDREFTDLLHQLSKEHDEGWQEYDDSFLNQATSDLIHFPDVENKLHSTIWKKSVKLLEDSGNLYGAACLCEHAAELSDEKPELQEFLHQEKVKLLREAFPNESPEIRKWRLERGFLTLRFADLMTLMPCSGWKGPIPSSLIDEEGRSHEIDFLEIEPWVIQLDPWPLLNADHVIKLKGFCFSKDVYSQSGAFDWSPYAQNLILKFVPK